MVEVTITANAESHKFNLSERDFELLIRIASSFEKDSEPKER